MKKFLCVSFIFAVISFLCFATENLSAAEQPYYKGKAMSIIVPHGPGGGYDRMARIVAKHIGKHIPGNPSAVVENMGGGGTIIGTNHLYNTAKPDGLTIGIINKGTVFAQTLGVKQARFDMRKFQWLGSTAVETNVLCILKELPYNTFDELKKAKKQVVIGSVNLSSTAGQFMAFAKEFLKLDNVKVVYYPASGDVFLAVERKEVDGAAIIYSSTRPLIQRGVLKPIVRGMVKEKGLENIPSAYDLMSDEKGKSLFKLYSKTDQFGRAFAAPPKTPPELVNILRDAFENLVKDKEFIKDAEDVLMEVEYTDPKSILDGMTELVSLPPETVKEMSKFIRF